MNQGSGRAVPISIGLGSNVGDSRVFLQKAVDRLAKWVRLERASSIVSSAPMYELNQPDFLNAALIGTTDLGPRELIAGFKQIEEDLGREKRYVNGPREIDIDLITYGALKYGYNEEIQVPHPRLAERRFVLQPLAEIAPGLLIPGLGVVEILLVETNDQSNFVQTIVDAKISIPS